MTDTANPVDPSSQYKSFRERRDRAVSQPQGNLALVATELITGDPEQAQSVWGVPGKWAPLPAGQSGLRLVAEASEGITVDDIPVDGEVIVRGKDHAAPGNIVFSDTVTGFVIAREDGYALRVWDARSEAIQTFGTIDAFAYDPDWVVSARFTPLPGATLPFEHSKDEGRTREIPMPGEISFSKDGVDYHLAAISSGRALQVVFADATSGDSTYSVGRFLFVVPDAAGDVVLNFNHAVLPPCAFSYAFNCPMPPKQNRFPFPIEAGEKNVMSKEGALLHA